MEIFKLKNIEFAYPDGRKALDDVNLTVKKGEFFTVCGRSGCGKTTLLRLLKPTVAPHGRLLGGIFFDGRSISELDEKTLASSIGFVMQNPENQIVTDKVWHELSFGLENLGVKTPEIRSRVAEMASFFGIEEQFYDKTTELSGGQKQILSLAAVMVMRPQVLILDEPTSRLDPIAASEFLNVLKKINNEFGTTIILAEHRMEEIFAISDRVAVMERGKIITVGAPREVGSTLKESGSDMYRALPVPIRVFESVKDSGICPVTIREGRAWLGEFAGKNGIEKVRKHADPEKSETAAIEVKEAFFRYERGGRDVVKNLNLTVHENEITAILGGNGTGKTTALSLISGINKPQRGEIYIKGRKISDIPKLYDGLLGVMPQEPQSLFAKKTVFSELMEMTDKKKTQDEREASVVEIANLCKISDLLENHPYDLSGGEQQRTALAMILLKKPQIVIMDEPTKGMDAHFKMIFANILRDLKRGGATVLMVSHDLEFCAEIADRCALFFDGTVVTAEETHEFFKNNSFYTTAARRMSRGIIDGAVTAEDIIAALGGECEINAAEPCDYTPSVKPETEKKKTKPPKISRGIFFAVCLAAVYILKLTETVDFWGKNYILGGAAILLAGLCAASFMPDKGRRMKQPVFKKGAEKRTKLAAWLILLAIPFTIFFGIYYLGDRKYYFISLLIVLETLLPFIMIFENRKARAREIVLVSVLCTLGVAGRAAFFMVPEFKPLLAVIIISGACMGGETGFLVGAMSGFVSNFFFGQGPWTPWQMFALGIVGFISGVIFGSGICEIKKLSISMFGFFAALLIYGGIMNPASVFMVTANPTKEMIYAAFLTGFPVDLIHAMSTALFLWFLSEPMIDKLERVKTKYGLLED